MIEYRLYYMDDVGRISHASFLNCESDDDAMLKARGIEYEGYLEVWQGGRRVERLEPKRGPPSAKWQLFPRLGSKSA